MIILSGISDTEEVITDRLANIDFCLFFTKLAIRNVDFKTYFTFFHSLKLQIREYQQDQDGLALDFRFFRKITSNASCYCSLLGMRRGN